MESFQFCYWPVGDPRLRLTGLKAPRAAARQRLWKGCCWEAKTREAKTREGRSRGRGGGAAPSDSAVEPGGGCAQLDDILASWSVGPGETFRLWQVSRAERLSGRAAWGGATEEEGGATSPGPSWRLPRRAQHARAHRRGRRRRPAASTPSSWRSDGRGSGPETCPPPCQSLPDPRIHERPGQRGLDASRRSGTWWGEQRALELVPSLPCRGTLTTECKVAGRMGSLSGNVKSWLQKVLLHCGLSNCFVLSLGEPPGSCSILLPCQAPVSKWALSETS